MRGSAPGAVLQLPSSRRALLRDAAVGVAGGSVALLTACSTKPPKSPPAATPGVRPDALGPDVAVLNELLDREHAAIAAYTAGIPLLSHYALAAARQFLAQESSHATELAALIQEGDGKPNPPRASYDLGNPRRDQDVLSLLHGIEAAAIAAYLDAIPRLTPGAVRSTVASILANEAQHISFLRLTLGRRPVPSAFVSAVE